jgi:hypothetical protein
MKIFIAFFISHPRSDGPRLLWDLAVDKQREKEAAAEMSFSDEKNLLIVGGSESVI